MIKKIVYFLIFLTLCVSGCSVKNHKPDLYQSILKKGHITVGISLDAKPFGFINQSGQIDGMEADLAREIADRILGDESKIVFKNISAQDRIKAVTSGEVDMVISTMTITPDRKKLISFSEPYFIAGQAICVRKDSRIESLYDLINKRIIVILGTTGEDNIKRFLPNALIQGYTDNTEAINAFKTGDDDAITTDDALLQGLVIDNANYKLLPKRLTKEPYGIAFKKTKEAEIFRKNVNKVINDLKLDGTLQTIKNEWELDQ